MVYMLFLMLESGRVAIERLVEFDPERVQNIISILLSELVAYGLLLEIVGSEMREGPGSGAHAERLQLRRSGYMELVPRLYRRAVKHRGSEDWQKAVALLGELNRRYQDVFGQPIVGA